MVRLFFIFSCLIIFNSSSFAKDYKIGELLDLAEENSVNIKAANYRALAQKHLANQQKYWNNPSISFVNNSNQNTYGISQKIPFFGKLQNKYDIEEAGYQILDVRRENLTLLVKAEVFSLLYKYQALKQKISLAKKRLYRLSSVRKYLNSIALNSPTKRAQAKITKDSIRLIERDLLKYRNESFQTWNRVNIFLNLKEEPNKIILDWIDDKNYKGRQFLVDAAIENNFDLKEQKLLIKKYNSELKFAKIEQMPDFNVSINREENNSASLGNKDSTEVGLSVSIPIFNRNQEKTISAQSKINAQKHELEFRTNQLINLISNDINEFEVSLKLAKKFPTSSIKNILIGLNHANTDFKKGVLDFITYLQLDSQEYQMLDAVIDTQVEVADSYANLMVKIGKFIFPENEQ